MATDPSPTDVFEDAEIAREEAALRGALMNVLCNAINYPSEVSAHILGQDLTKLIGKTTDALIKLGYTRQSPASTTAADAWDEGFDAGWDAATTYVDTVNPYRVAAPEGDGGNE